MRLAPFAGEDTLVVPAPDDVTVGDLDSFAVLLTRNHRAMAGEAEVLELHAETVGAPATMKLKLVDLDAESRRVHERLLARRRTTSEAGQRLGRSPVPGNGPGTPPPPAFVAEPDATLLGQFVARAERVSDAEAATVPPAGRVTNGMPAVGSGPTRKVSYPSPPPPPPPAAIAPPLSTALAPTESDMRAPALTPSLGFAPTAALALPSALDDDVLVETPPASVRWRSPPPLEPTGGVARLPEEPSSLRRWAVKLGPWAGGLAAGFLLGLWVRGAPPPVPAPAAKSAAPAAAPPPVAAAAAAEIAAPPPPAPAPVDGTNCRLTVISEPAGASVTLGERTLGKTPLTDESVPCGKALLALRRPRYEPLVRALSLHGAEALRVRERLQRPEAHVRVVSHPAGAQLVVNGQPVGTTPHEATVPRFESVRLSVDRAGYARWTKRLYVNDASETVSARLKATHGGKRTRRH